jgi:hypothetical protein
MGIDIPAREPSLDAVKAGAVTGHPESLCGFAGRYKEGPSAGGLR